VRNGASKTKVNTLLALSSSAVLAVYAAGYVRTRAAADRFAQQTDARVRPLVVATRPAVPAPAALTSIAAPAPVTVPPRAGAERAHDRKSRQPHAATHGADAASLPLAPQHEKPAAATTPGPPEASTTAPPAPAAPEGAVAPATPRYKDGTYLGWGTSRHGDIQAQVIIEDGRIASATIAQCLTRYSCSVIAKLPPQVAERQSPEVDYVSGATQSADAFYYAVVDALSKAK